MRTDTDNFAMVDNYYLVGSHNGTYPLRYDEYRCIPRFFLESLSEGGIGLEIKGGKAVIKYVYLRLFGQCPGNR